MLPLMTSDFLDRYDACGFTFVHGHDDINKNFNNLILGHEHPTIQIEMERHPMLPQWQSYIGWEGYDDSSSFQSPLSRDEHQSHG
jgi:hypothetical protein